MPTYDYECAACGHRFERFQPITAKPLRTCPKCRKARVNRLLGTGAALLFKGSGFYATDYRSRSYQQAAKKEGGGAGEAKSDGAAKSEAKPAAGAGRGKES